MMWRKCSTNSMSVRRIETIYGYFGEKTETLILNLRNMNLYIIMGIYKIKFFLTI